jgi:hypothetical protein
MMSSERSVVTKSRVTVLGATRADLAALLWQLLTVPLEDFRADTPEVCVAS